MNSEDISLSSLSGEEGGVKVAAGGEEGGQRLRPREHRHKHKKKHKRHSHKHKHRHKSSSRKERRHKKHRCKHRPKDSESDSGESEDEELQLIDDILESSLQPPDSPVAVCDIPSPPPKVKRLSITGRDVEILRSSAGNGIVESMKIVVDNRNGSRDQPVTVSSSEEEMASLEIGVSNDENSREMSRRAEEFTLDSSDFLHIDEDLNLEELMKQKAALQARLGAYMSDVDDDDDDEETGPPPVTAGTPQQAPPAPHKLLVAALAAEKKPVQEVFTIEDSDDAEPKRRDRKKERESRPKKRKRSSASVNDMCLSVLASLPALVVVLRLLVVVVVVVALGGPSVHLLVDRKVLQPGVEVGVLQEWIRVSGVTWIDQEYRLP
ncbi:hypothetical protein GWK47_053817 [Chionoecetes opilio]|uniref:Uncharacterized protein n=1 Tax=Chionoecetes opilio TaxID=41210 RepID=A0A8J4Y538_CHIOP|nr:hypothetical protein GWK47_053817 [Chionoecetes opilio]